MNTYEHFNYQSNHNPGKEVVVYPGDDAARRKFLANLGNIFILWQIEQNQKAEADSQAANPKKSASAGTLAENPQAKGESTTK